MVKKALAVVISCLAILIVSVSATEQTKLLSFSQIENLKYSDSRTPDVKTQSILNIIGSDAALLKAYEIGLDAVKQYHEPILTRGARGITLYRTASPAVVLVVVGHVVNNKFEESGLGTGVLVDSRGYVLTNWHVIDGFNKAAIFMKPTSGSSLEQAPLFIGSVVASDQIRDLALLKMDKSPQPISTIPIASIGQVQVAEDVHIIGHPHGYYWSYTTGVISQVRDDYGWKYSDGSEHKAKVLQMQTAINPGNSGGPVLDDNGSLIGLVAMTEEGQNLDYAIAADEIQNFLNLRLPVRTRGVSSTEDVENSPSKTTSTVANTTYSTALLGDDRTVTKSQWNGVTSYLVTDGSGHPIQAFFKIGSQTGVLSDWVNGGYFQSYVMTTESGKELHATRTERGLTMGNK